MGKWYGGGGIMHQKIWVFDRAPHVPRLGQHGLEVDHAGKGNGRGGRRLPRAGRRCGKVFRCWWAFSATTPSSVEVVRSAGADRSARAAMVGARAERSSAQPVAVRPRSIPHRVQPEDSADASKSSGERAGVFLTGCPNEVLRFRADVGRRRPRPHHRRCAQIHMRERDGFRPGRPLRP